jgi:SAM-dependent methyltransferase
MTTTETAPEIDLVEVETFGGQMMGFLNGASAALMLSVGHRLGLLDAMAGRPPSTSAEVAAATSLDERYVREWLGAMATAGVVRYDGGRDAFLLPAEHAALTTRAAGPNNFAAFMQLIPMLAGVEDEIIERFRSGGGVPYTAYHRFHETMAELSGAVFDANLVAAALPLVPGLIEKLERGIDVADIATGSGHAVNVMARAFPNSRFVGFDLSDDAIERGRAEAAAWQLDNATFEATDVAALGRQDQFDFITTFDAVHDQARPRVVVKAIYDALRPSGSWLCVDVQASSNVGENLAHPIGTFGYTVSCLHCMTVSLAYGGEGLGAMWGVQKAKEIFAEAGFTDVTIHTVAGDPMNSYYVCHK